MSWIRRERLFSAPHLLTICSADLKIPLLSGSLAGEEDACRRCCAALAVLMQQAKPSPPSSQPDLPQAWPVIVTPSCDGWIFYILRHASSLVPRVCAVYSAACIIPNSTQGARRPLRRTPAENNPAKDGSRRGYVKKIKERKLP